MTPSSVIWNSTVLPGKRGLDVTPETMSFAAIHG